MAENTEVGTAYVAIIPSAKGFARNLQKAIAKEFAGSKLDEMIAEALAGTTVSVPVRPTIDPGEVPDEVPVRPGREPGLPVRLDPLTEAFQAEVRRQLAALPGGSVDVPVGADTDQWRADVAAAVDAVESTVTADVPTEPGGLEEFERQLRTEVAEAAERVDATVDVDLDLDKPLTGKVETAGDAAGQSLASRVRSAFTSSLGSVPPPVLFAPLIAGAVATGPLIAATIAGGVLTGLGGGVIALGILGVKDDPRFKAAASSLGTTIQTTLTKAAGPLLGTEDKPGPLLRAMKTLEDLVVEIGPSLEQMFTSIGPYLPGLAEGIAEFVREAMPGLLKAVEAAGPLLEVIALNMGPLGESVSTFLTAMAALGPAAGDAFNVIFFLVNHAITTISGFLYLLGAAFSGLFQMAKDAQDNLTRMWEVVKAGFSAGVTFVRERVEAVVGWVLRQFDRMSKGVQQAITSTVGFFRDLPGRITNAVGNLGNLLYQSGRNVIQGLINGIKSMFGALGGAAAGAAAVVKNHFPFSPAKEGPLSGKGNPYYSGVSIVDLLASGITGNLGTARAAASTLAETFALSGSPLVTAPPGGYGLNATALAAPAPQLDWAPGTSGDPVLDAFRELIRIRYGGDVQAAMGTGD